MADCTLHKPVICVWHFKDTRIHVANTGDNRMGTSVTNLSPFHMHSWTGLSFWFASFSPLLLLLLGVQQEAEQLKLSSPRSIPRPLLLEAGTSCTMWTTLCFGQ